MTVQMGGVGERSRVYGGVGLNVRELSHFKLTPET